MIEALLQERAFRSLMETHAREIVELLVERGSSFSILCNIALVEFDPPLPEAITRSFHPLTLFVLAGYTFSSIETDEKNLCFEAGFGTENMGSFVTVPWRSLLQIILQDEESAQDSVLFINLAATLDDNEPREIEEEGVKSSMEALLSNPENHRFKK